MSNMNNQEMTEQLIEQIVATKTNKEFIEKMDYFFKTHQIEILIKDYQEKIRYECFILDENILSEINERFSGQVSYECLRYDDVEI